MSKLEGRYTGTLKTLQYGTTSNGNDQVVCELEVTQGPDAGRRCTAFLVFTDEWAHIKVDQLREMGWAGEDLGALVKPGTDEPSFTPKEFDFTVKYEMREGKERMDVTIHWGGGGRVEVKAPMNDGQKRAFGAKFNHLVKAGAQAPARGTGTDFNYGHNTPPAQQQAPAQRASVKL